MRARQGIAAALAGLAAAGLVAACGVNTDDAGTPTAPRGPNGASTAPRRPAQPLPPAPPGTVRVDALRGGLGSIAGRGFVTHSNVNLALIQAPDQQSFADLCAGRVDVAEVARLPTEGELAACRDRGVDISEPLQVAADAEVIATKNEADVGGDCVTAQQARDIFRAGSPYTSWSQLGFYDLPLTTTGRQQGSPNFTFFGQVVLGVDDPTMADVRADYVVERSDLAEREEVTGARRERVVRARIARYGRDLRARTQRDRQRRVNAAIARADHRTVAAIDRENRDRARRKVALTPAQAAAIDARNRRRVDRAKRAAARRVNAAVDREIADRVRRFGGDLLAEAKAPGVVGGFRFSYYELFEDQLRPLEIDYGVPVTASGEPVTLDDLTEKDRARLLRLTTSPTQTQTVPNVGTAPTVTTPGGETTTVPTQQAIPDLPARELPKETKDGEPIYPGPNCVFPSQVTITSGAYPFSRRLFAFTSRQSLRRAEVVQYLVFLLEDARALATQNRLVPITDAQLADELAIVHNHGRQPPPQPVTTPATTTRTVTTPQGTTTVETVTTTTPSTTPTTTAPGGGSGIPGVSGRGGA